MLYVRQLAWLNATPKGTDKPRRKQIDIAADAQGCEPDYQLPDVGCAGYFIDLLSQVGEARISGSELEPLDWSTLHAWQVVTGAKISPGDAEAIIYLSSSYVTQYIKSMDSACMSPHMEQPADDVESKIKAMVKMLKG